MLIPHQVKGVKRHFDFYSSAQPAVVSAKPTLYATPKAPTAAATTPPKTQVPSVDFSMIQTEVEKKLKKLKKDRVYFYLLFFVVSILDFSK